jgi:hypothetical protein
VASPSSPCPPCEPNAQDELAEADDEIGAAKQALAAHDYAGAFDHARRAYQLVREGADEAGVEVVASENGWTVQPPRKELRGPVKRDYSFKDRIGEGTKRSPP